MRLATDPPRPDEIVLDDDIKTAAAGVGSGLARPHPRFGWWPAAAAELAALGNLTLRAFPVDRVVAGLVGPPQGEQAACPHDPADLFDRRGRLDPVPASGATKQVEAPVTERQLLGA